MKPLLAIICFVATAFHVWASTTLVTADGKRYPEYEVIKEEADRLFVIYKPETGNAKKAVTTISKDLLPPELQEKYGVKNAERNRHRPVVRERYYRDSKGTIISEKEMDRQLRELRSTIQRMPDNHERAYQEGMLRALEEEWNRIKRRGPISQTDSPRRTEESQTRLNDSFYEPNRALPYYSSKYAGHKTKSEAMVALAKQFEESTAWVERNMGRSNSLTDIHNNLVKAKFGL